MYNVVGSPSSFSSAYFDDEVVDVISSVNYEEIVFAGFLGGELAFLSCKITKQFVSYVPHYESQPIISLLGHRNLLAMA